MQEAVKEQIKKASEGYTAHPYIIGRAVERKMFGIEYYPDVNARSIGYGCPGLTGSVHSNAKEEGDGEKEVEKVEEKIGEEMPGVPTQAEAVELDAEPNSSPSPHNLTESPERIQEEQLAQTNPGLTLFQSTIQGWRKQNEEETQDDNRSSSTEGGPFKHGAPRGRIPVITETVMPGNRVSAATTPKGKAKKDSKVEGLMEEDGVSLKDFATMSDGQKPKGTRKFSIRKGASRPQWR